MKKLACILVPCLVAVAPTVGQTPPNLLVVTLDTTRADHLSVYGYPLPTTPELQRVADGGVVFEQARSQVPLTGPSHTTMMTGLYPQTHGAVRNGVPMRDEVRTLAQVLSEEGYATAAFVSGWTLRDEITGLGRGFDVYDDTLDDRYRVVNVMRSAQSTTDVALDWLREQSGPWFLWVHFFDAHSPYKKRREFPPFSLSQKPDGYRRHEHMPRKVAAYDSEIAYADSHLGRLLDHLETRGLVDSTLVMVTADHGEAFEEHGYLGHGREVYEEIVRVPLVLRMPGRIAPGTRSATPSELVDLAPTALDLMGYGADRLPQAQGMALLTAAGAPTAIDPDRAVHFMTYPGARKKGWRVFSPSLELLPTRIGFVEGSHKFVNDTQNGRLYYFDLATDPGEHRNLSASEGSLEPLAESLTRWFETTAEPTQETPLDADDLDKLRALGYID